MKISKRKNRNLYYCNVKKPDGKYQMIYGKTKKEVREKADSLISDVKNGRFVDKNNVTLCDWLKEWSENYLINLTVTTKMKYISAIENNIIPYFNDVKIQKLTHNQVQTFVNDLNQKYSAKTVQNIVNVLHRALKDAVINGFISLNPADNLILPKRVKKEMNVLDFDEIPEFLQKAQEMTPEYADCFEFLLLTGLRLGEFIGLTIDSYDPVEKTIKIDKQFQNMTRSFMPPKHNVIRTIALDDRAVKIIEDRIKQIEKIKDIFPKFNEDNFIFLNPEYRRITQTTLRKYMKKVCKEIGRPELRIHDLRHTFATMTLAAGTDIKSLQERLGHSDSTFTMNKYAHSTLLMNKNAAKDLGVLYSQLKKFGTKFVQDQI